MYIQNNPMCLRHHHYIMGCHSRHFSTNYVCTSFHFLSTLSLQMNVSFLNFPNMGVWMETTLKHIKISLT